MSSLFQNGLFNSPSANNTSFHPLFRLLDDFEQHQRNTTDNEHPHRQHRVTTRSFTPKFDVKELPDAYELHGDLPGIEQKDVEIEFTDVQTITVRGRTERSYSSGSTPSGFIEGSATPTQAIEGSQNTSADQSHKPAAHKATVQDEDEDNTNTTVTTTSKNSDVTSNKQHEKTEPKAKYWVSERSVGEFSRSFTFPVRVDQEKVTAGMKNGVLTITVPKAKKHEAKRIQISSL
ncbi:related to heat shock protein 30 [Rhynchosporium secalis]|uniref:Related to heat shock protein 30 n=1 Tax=Rhynchosporium secalis TaxID=38038 RepID=A0A1E1M0Z9_RHYSE|nr:related to heat shock protein 30 [Rhynchosporium secalis]